MYTHKTHTYGLTSHITMEQCQVAKYTYIYTYPHNHCALVTAVRNGLPWRSWLTLRDWWDGGVLRETQSRER